MNNMGRHVICDAYLNAWPGDFALLKKCGDAIKQSQMTVVSCSFKKFDPDGLTAVWILEESHFTLHTYPEHKYISVDCYTCGDEGRPDIAVQALIKNLDVGSSKMRTIRRGRT